MAPTTDLKIAILDDDPAFTQLQELLIGRKFPGAMVDVFHRPTSAGGYDIYLIDNRFGQKDLALHLCEEIRTSNPASLIIVWSAHVTKDLLKRLSPLGINAVAEKGDQADVDAAFQVMESFVGRGAATPQGFSDTIRSIRDLLAHWNNRLDTEEKQVVLQ